MAATDIVPTHQKPLAFQGASTDGELSLSFRSKADIFFARCRRSSSQWCAISIQTAMATIITFSVSETKPSGTLLDPPTQAHLISRLST